MRKAAVLALAALIAAALAGCESPAHKKAASEGVAAAASGKWQEAADKYQIAVNEDEADEASKKSLEDAKKKLEEEKARIAKEAKQKEFDAYWEWDKSWQARFAAVKSDASLAPRAKVEKNVALLKEYAKEADAQDAKLSGDLKAVHAKYKEIVKLTQEFSEFVLQNPLPADAAAQMQQKTEQLAKSAKAFDEKMKSYIGKNGLIEKK